MSKPTTKITKQVYQDVLDRDGRKCKLCSSPYWLNCHHIIPCSNLGLGIPDNLVMLCKRCHDTVHSNMKHWTPILLEMNGVTDKSKLKLKNKWVK